MWIQLRTRVKVGAPRQECLRGYSAPSKYVARMKIIALPYLCSGTTFPPRTDLRWPGQCVLLCECLLGWSFVVDYTVGCTVLYQQGQVTKLYTDRGLFLIIIASKHMGHRKRDETGIFFIIIGDIYYILCTHPFIIYIMQYFSPSHN